MRGKKAASGKKEVPVKKEKAEVDHGIHLLMNKFLFEIFKLIRARRITKAQLASLLHVSPGYLSQVFHGKKPLTFQMLDRMQQELKIVFEIKINDVSEQGFSN